MLISAAVMDELCTKKSKAVPFQHRKIFTPFDIFFPGMAARPSVNSSRDIGLAGKKIYRRGFNFQPLSVMRLNLLAKRVLTENKLKIGRLQSKVKSLYVGGLGKLL